MSPKTPADPRKAKADAQEPIEEQPSEGQDVALQPSESQDAESQASEGQDAALQASDGEDAPPPAAERSPRPARLRRAGKGRRAAKAPGAKGATDTAAQGEPARKPASGQRGAGQGARTPTPAPAAASARKARGARGTPRRRVVRARARYVRTSARKARMLCGHLRGRSVDEARAILAFTPREVARDWSKLLESAVANAEANHELLADELIVREAYADEGPTIKRFRPRAMGRATPIRKRTTHLTITLTSDPGKQQGNRHS